MRVKVRTIGDGPDKAVTYNGIDVIMPIPNNDGIAHIRFSPPKRGWDTEIILTVGTEFRVTQGGTYLDIVKKKQNG